MDLHSVDASSARGQAGVGDRMNLHEVGAWRVVALGIPSVVPDCNTTIGRQRRLLLTQGKTKQSEANSKLTTQQSCLTMPACTPGYKGLTGDKASHRPSGGSPTQ